MATRIPYAFASTGDTTVVPDTSVGTELSIQSGWSSAYELAPEDAGYREIDRGQHNYLWNAITANIKEWQDQTYPDIVSTVDYPVGSIVVYSGLPYVKFQNDDGAVSDPSLSNDWKIFNGLGEVSPRNNNWNGYLDPEHQLTLPAPNGYPATSGGGGTAYTSDQEISYGIFAGASGATVSSDSDGWIVSAGSIYRLYTYTIEQLADIDVNTAPIFIRDEAGNNYYINNSTTGVTVSKPDATTLRVELNSGLFAELGITKMWRWFDTDRIGHVNEISAYDLRFKLELPIRKNVTGSRTFAVTYTNTTKNTRKVIIRFLQSGGIIRSVLIVNGNLLHGCSSVGLSGSDSNTIEAEILPGDTYYLSLTQGNMNRWEEIDYE